MTDLVQWVTQEGSSSIHFFFFYVQRGGVDWLHGLQAFCVPLTGNGTELLTSRSNPISWIRAPLFATASTWLTALHKFICWTPLSQFQQLADWNLAKCRVALVHIHWMYSTPIQGGRGSGCKFWKHKPDGQSWHTVLLGVIPGPQNERLFKYYLVIYVGAHWGHNSILV